MHNSILIIGGGPAGIFTAYELIQLGYGGTIKIIEKGDLIQNRHCPKSETNYCLNCSLCKITSGVGGSGSFSDAKLSLNLIDVGGDIASIIGVSETESLTKYTDNIYLKFGADPHIEGLENTEEVKQLRLRAIQANLKLVDCPVRHLGTEKSRELYTKLQNYLIDNGVEILTNSECNDLIIENNRCSGAIIKGTPYFADKVVVAVGRKGAYWLEGLCDKHNIKHIPGTVDIGVRVECRNEVMEIVNKYFYEGKFIGYPEPFRNKVRTFCQNPGGFVAQENYDSGLACVNGHSFKELKSNNTNLSILVSHNFTTPFNQPIEYARKVGELTNMLGAGSILVQRYGDILKGKRTWQDELDRSNLKPTLPDAVTGDITAAMPYRAMTNIINFIQALDKVVPGFASDETLLYSPELKFYSNKIEMDKDLNTSIENLYCLGDGSGITHGLMSASLTGVYCARKIMNSKILKES